MGPRVSTPLSERYRTITTSLCGYGKTQERRRPGGAHIEDEMDVLEAVLMKADAPVHLVAHSFGAWVALALAVVPMLSLSVGVGDGFVDVDVDGVGADLNGAIAPIMFACVAAGPTAARHRALAVGLGLRAVGIVPDVYWDLQGLVWPLEIICYSLLPIWH